MNYKNIKFINYPDFNFYNNLPNNIIIVGGKDYDINLENEIKNYDCVIRIHPYRAYEQHFKANQNNIITKTDYIYTWTGRALSIDLNYNNNLKNNQIQNINITNIKKYDNKLSNMIPNLKGIIFHIDVNNKCNNGCDQLSPYEKKIIDNIYHNQLDEYILFHNRKNIYYIEYLKYNNDITPTNINHFLKKMKIENKINNNCSIASGMRIILNCLFVKKNITIVGFSLNINETQKYDFDNHSNYKKQIECKGKNCSSHSFVDEAIIIKELLEKNRIKLLK